MPKKKFLGVIPARAGSKRIIHKNTVDLCGKPLIAWTVDAALKSRHIDHIAVSTDDQKVIDICRAYPVQVIRRPEFLASDDSKTIDAILHTIENITDDYEYVILLQPTSPLRTARHIDEAIELLNAKKADGVVSVTKAEHSPLWMNTLPEDKSMAGFLSDEIKNKRSQDLPVYYQLNGSIFIAKTSALIKEKSFFLKDNIYAYEMENQVSVDIDTKTDLKFTRVLAEENM